MKSSHDLVIGAVLIRVPPRAQLVRRNALGHEKGSVIIDVAIDQGSCFETSHATTHSDPTYEVDRCRPLLRRQHACRARSRSPRRRR